MMRKLHILASLTVSIARIWACAFMLSYFRIQGVLLTSCEVYVPCRWLAECWTRLRRSGCPHHPPVSTCLSCRPIGLPRPYAASCCLP